MSICSYVGCGIPVIYACYCDTDELYFCNYHIKDHITRYPAIDHRYQQAFIDAQSEIRKRMKILFNSISKKLGKIKNFALLNASNKFKVINKWVYEYLENINHLENDLLVSLRQILSNKVVSEDKFENLQIKAFSYLDQIKSWACLDDVLNPANKIISKQYNELDELRLLLFYEKSKTEKLEKDLNESISTYQAAISEKEHIISDILQSGDYSNNTMQKNFIANENKITQLEKAIKHIQNKKKQKKYQIEALMQANLFLARFLDDPHSPSFIKKYFSKNDKEEYDPITNCLFDDCEWPGGDLIDHLKIYHRCKECLVPKEGTIKFWNAKVWKICEWDIWILKLASGVSIIMKSFCDNKGFYVHFYDLETERIKLKLTFANSETKMQFSLRTESLTNWYKPYREMPFCMNLYVLEKCMLALSDELEGYKKLCILIEAKGIA